MTADIPGNGVVTVNGPQDYACLDVAAEIITNGGVVVFPTETVYGVGSSLDSRAAQKLAAVKQRPADKPFTLHICSLDQMFAYEPVLDADSERIVREFMPGPITVIVLCRKTGTTLGFRFPDDPVALELIKRVGKPVYGTSANLSGQASPVDSAQVIDTFAGKVDLIIDAGKTRFENDSTIIDLSKKGFPVIRAGVISEEILKG